MVLKTTARTVHQRHSKNVLGKQLHALLCTWLITWPQLLVGDHAQHQLLAQAQALLAASRQEDALRANLKQSGASRPAIGNTCEIAALGAQLADRCGRPLPTLLGTSTAQGKIYLSSCLCR
jgi:hypothetical protein